MSETNSLGSVSAGPLFDGLAGGLRIVSGAALCALVLLVAAEAGLRGFANYSLGYAEEITGYLVVSLTFFGAALALRSGSLFQVHFLFDLFPAPVRLWLLRLFVLAALVICAIMAVKGYDLMASSMKRGKFAPTVLRTPLWIPQTLIPVGFGLISLFLVEKLLTARRLIEGSK